MEIEHMLTSECLTMSSLHSAFVFLSSLQKSVHAADRKVSMSHLTWTDVQQ